VPRTIPLPRRAATERATTERATTLVLVPAMMLVLIALAAVAIDLTAVHVAQRSLYRTVSAAADDAAGMLDTRRIQLDGRLQVDCPSARRVIDARLRSADLPGPMLDLNVMCTDDRVDVRARVAVQHVFLAAVPGAPDIDDVPIAVRARVDP
jgi:hypothetical protein